MAGDRLQLTILRDEFVEVVGICDALQVAAIDGLGLIVLCDGDSLKSFAARGHIHVTSHEIHEVGALQQELRHPGIVVVRCGNVAIAALLRFLRTHRVRHERAEGLAGEAPAETVCCV